MYQAEKEDGKFEAFARRAALLAEADKLRQEIRHSQLSAFREETVNRKGVLRQLQHIDEDGEAFGGVGGGGR